MPDRFRRGRLVCCLGGDSGSARKVDPEADSKLAIVLVDHGSKRAEANRMLEEFAELYRCGSFLVRYVLNFLTCPEVLCFICCKHELLLLG